MPDHFKSPRLRIARAKKHIGDLEGEIGAFIDTVVNTWSHVIEPHPNGIYKEHKVKLQTAFPDHLAPICADAVHNLRSVLDQSVAASARASGIIPKIGTAAFPFSKDETGIANAIEGKCASVPADIRAVIRAFKPYKTDNPLLWALNRMRNVDDHALLSPILLFPRTVEITAYGDFTPEFFRAVSPFLNPLNNEIVFAVTDADKPHPDYDFKISPEIAFGEIDGVRGQPAIRTLNGMARVVERILVCIERETRRLFPKAFE